MPIRHGGQILADQLAIHGCKRVFSIPGESFLPLLDGLHDSSISNIVCRHEGGASMMAEATAKLTGTPGVAIVTRGPGATNASSGIHVARHDSTPLLLLVGQVARVHRHREAFQEIDFERFFSPIAKWAAEISDTERIPEYIARAYQVAQSGRPGPVVLSLPEDMLHAECETPDGTPRPIPDQAVRNRDVRRIADALQSSERPLIVVGGSHWSQKAADNLARVSTDFGVPVAAGFRRQHYFDNKHPNYAGDLTAGMNPRLAEAVKASDCILLLGTRFGDTETRGYELVDVTGTGKRIMQVHPDPEETGRLWETEIVIAARPERVVKTLVRLGRNSQAKSGAWLEHCRSLRRDWLKQDELPGDVRMSEVVAWLSENLDDQAIVTNGAGNYAAFLHRYFCHRRFGTQVASTSGSMGYGLPAAIAAKLERPDRTVVCMAGDGCFQMVMNEFSTAVQFGAKLVAVIANNGMYGTIRMHQEKHYPGRVSGTSLGNPDFAALAAAHGGHGETVKRTDEFPDAFLRAARSGKPAIIDLQLHPDAISSTATIQDLRAASLNGS